MAAQAAYARVPIMFSVAKRVTGSLSLAPSRCALSSRLLSSSFRGGSWPRCVPSEALPASRNLRRPFPITSMSSGGGSPFKSVSVEEANKLLTSGYTYLDVRTKEEFAAGHVEGSVNIPIMNSGPAGFVPAPNFLEEVQEQFPPDTPLVVACKAGGRSKRAASELVQAGYSKVIDVDGGFMVWVQKGLPTTR